MFLISSIMTYKIINLKPAFTQGLLALQGIIYPFRQFPQLAHVTIKQNRFIT